MTGVVVPDHIASESAKEDKNENPGEVEHATPEIDECLRQTRRKGARSNFITR